jgi:hypothetical protein
MEAAAGQKEEKTQEVREGGVVKGESEATTWRGGKSRRWPPPEKPKYACGEG